ncbi:hypothetical protein GCM10010363_50460 [Streptomyces omiyaensis]|uniref:hypothetical protein n=1 Tax=Streptomyces omiyaensis TaxID=68247 RepID=UPI00167B808D|nr:hypothetical protein [Streptomyces omiyaensis]GGY62816.1 hypothetical protein GCM10010363_50460 [Streptomyces omiyaensis]
MPKDDTGRGIRALHDAARSTVKARTATLDQVAHILITAPDDIRVKCTALRGKTRVDAISRLRPTGDGPRVVLLTALKTLARRVQALTAEHDVRTRACIARQTAAGGAKKEIIRLLGGRSPERLSATPLRRSPSPTSPPSGPHAGPRTSPPRPSPSTSESGRP